MIQKLKLNKFNNNFTIYIKKWILLLKNQDLLGVII